MPNTKSGLCNVINCEIPGGKWLIYVKVTVLLLGDWYVASTAIHLGEERFFSEAFAVFCYISAIFLMFCLVKKVFFVYLHMIEGVDANSHSNPIIQKKV